MKHMVGGRCDAAQLPYDLLNNGLLLDLALDRFKDYQN